MDWFYGYFVYHCYIVSPRVVGKSPKFGNKAQQCWGAVGRQELSSQWQMCLAEMSLEDKYR